MDVELWFKPLLHSFRTFQYIQNKVFLWVICRRSKLLVKPKSSTHRLVITRRIKKLWFSSGIWHLSKLDSRFRDDVRNIRIFGCKVNWYISHQTLTPSVHKCPYVILIVLDWLWFVFPIRQFYVLVSHNWYLRGQNLLSFVRLERRYIRVNLNITWVNVRTDTSSSKVLWV